MRGADLIAKTLSNAGVKVIFTLSGNQIMPIFDACIDVGIRLIHTRHEGAAVYMADAYAQLTGQVGVAMITAAPGFASGLGPLYTSHMAESPILLLSGDSPLSQDGQGSFQELDQIAISTPLTKLSLRPKAADELGYDVARALRTAASGRPGPVHMALPFDLLNNDIGDVPVPTVMDCAAEILTPTGHAINTIVDAVATAARPVVIAGPALNTTRTGDLISSLADALDAPVIPMESPRGLNDPSLGAFASVLAKADLIVSLGKNLDFSTGFAAAPGFANNAKIITIDPDADILDRVRRAASSRLLLAARADAQTTATALIAAAKGGTRSAWRQEMAYAILSRKGMDPTSTSLPMRPEVLCAAVQRHLDAGKNCILIIDGGEFGQWAQACLTANSRIINGPSGSIGGALCYALAAKIARPAANVVVLMGDGTAGFHFSEFETAHRYGADFMAIIGNDARWNAEYQIQLRDYGEARLNECELNPTHYDRAVVGLGGHGETITDPADLDAAITRAAKSGLPSCLNVMIEGLSAPAAPTH